MKSILDFYEKALSDENPVRGYAFFCASSLLFVYISAFVGHTYLFHELDKIAIKTKYPTIGFKTLLLIGGLLYSPVITIRRDLLIDESVWLNLSLLCLTVCGGLIIIFKPMKERACIDSTRFTLTFQSVGTMTYSLVGLSKMVISSYSSVFFLVYLVYVSVLVNAGKTDSIFMVPSVTRKDTAVKRLFDKILADSEDSTRMKWISLVVSPVVIGSLVYFTFLSSSTGWVGCMGVFFVGALVSLRSKKNSLVRNIYTFITACIIIKSLGENFYILLYSIFPDIIGTWPGYIFLNTIRLGFPIKIVLLVGMMLRRYKLCFSLSISMAIHVFLFMKPLIILLDPNPTSTDRTNIYAVASLIFTSTSNILLFANNELRRGLFEIEVGIILILLYCIYILYTRI